LGKLPLKNLSGWRGCAVMKPLPSAESADTLPQEGYRSHFYNTFDSRYERSIIIVSTARESLLSTTHTRSDLIVNGQSVRRCLFYVLSITDKNTILPAKSSIKTTRITLSLITLCNEWNVRLCCLYVLTDVVDSMITGASLRSEKRYKRSERVRFVGRAWLDKCLHPWFEKRICFLRAGEKYFSFMRDL
jgi:hypothetical protein